MVHISSHLINKVKQSLTILVPVVRNPAYTSARHPVRRPGLVLYQQYGALDDLEEAWKPELVRFDLLGLGWD